jgi:HEAT repeat protein
MVSSINITTQTLALSQNKSAIPLLEKALESSSKEVRQSAGNQLINLTGLKNVWTLINQFDPSDETIINIFNSHREKVFSALRAAIIGDDPYLARNAFRVIYTQRYFEILPVMLSTFLDQDRSDEKNKVLSEGILKLMEKYILALDERKNRRRLNKVVLSEIVTVLFQGLKDFHRNDPDLFVLVFLQIYPFLTDKHSALTKLLYVPSTALYGVAYRFLLSGREPYIFHFFVHCFSRPNPPPIALTVFSKRFDMPFIAYFLKNIEKPVSTLLKSNLVAVQPIEWLHSFRTLLDRLDEQAQVGLALLVQNLDFSEEEEKSKLLDLLHYGKTNSRLEALTALARFSGEEIDQLLWDAGGDANPNIQATALALLSKRNIPNANFRILQFANSPHEIVRTTIQKLLPDFRLARFFEMFDHLTEEQRRSMFNVVKVLDSQMVDELSRILIMGEPRDTAKALFCIDNGSLVLALEDSLCAVLAKGEVAAIRIKAAELLSAGKRDLSRSTLVQALHRDPDPNVRATAKSSLEKRPPQWEQLKQPK